jgi:small subunit ribosomal protein S20
MPTHKSAEKRLKQNHKRNQANRRSRSALRTAVKNTLELVAKGDKAGAAAAVKLTTKLLDTAATKGLIHKNNAARKVSRLNAKVSQLG